MIVKRFEEQVKKHPDKIAVKTNTIALTYSELDQRANKVANQILTYERRTQSTINTIALLFEHGTDMIVGTIAALKAGKVYVPFDPSYPENRLINMLKDSTAELLVTNKSNLEKASHLVGMESIPKPDLGHSRVQSDNLALSPAESEPESSKDVHAQIQVQSQTMTLTQREAECEPMVRLDILNIDQEQPHAAEVILDFAQLQRDDDLAYLLYTSGSTGKPKGVIQTQTNVLYFVENYINQLALTANDRLTLFSTFGHDAAVMDIYGGLLSGATLYPLNIKEQFHPERLKEWLHEEGITVWHSVPTLYRRFASTLQDGEKLDHLRLIVLGGEGVREHDVTLFKEHFPAGRLVNLYGQSESSFNSAQFIDHDTPFEKILLGNPISGTRLLLVDEKGKKVAPLRVGEIVVASNHVALGYWNNDGQTKKVFSSHPKLGRLYWTGDLGRLLLDGSIEFVGRKDFQIKVRGYRVETGEVESHLLKHPAIQEVVVVGRPDQEGEIALCAYYVPQARVKDQELRNFLGKHLPDHMIPSYLMELEEIPMTATGKVDRSALPDLTMMIESGAEYVAPRNEREERLGAIWSQILGVEQIGIDDDFFSLGGHSLKAATLVSRIYKEMNVELALGDIFTYPTIRQLSEMIAEAKTSIYTSLQTIPEQEYYQVSAAQRRIFVLDQLETGSVNYNMPKAMWIDGPLDVIRLEETMQKLVQRHESFRTTFKTVDGEVVQVIHPKVQLSINQMEAEEAELPKLMKQFVQPFNLDKAPLMRTALIRLSEDRHLLAFDMHHIISDGTSMSILIQEFVSLYGGEELTDLPIQYKDFAAWQNELFTSGAIDQQEQYWLDTFTGEIPVLNMPTDYPRPAMQSFAGDQIPFTLDAELSQRLRNLGKNTGTTLYMVLVAAYNLLLAKYSNQEEIVVGSPVAGRSHPDLQNLIGIFVNFLPMRNTLKGEQRFIDFLNEVKKNSIKAFENQNYQFDELVDRLNLKRQLDRNPLFDTMLILQNYEMGESRIENLRFTPYDQEQTVSKLDLTLNGMEVGEEIHFELEYCTKLFAQETMVRLIGHFRKILEVITLDPTLQLHKIDMLSAQEKEQILWEFNNTRGECSHNRLIHQLFEEQVRMQGEKLALVFEEQQLTYQEFNAKANQLARRLRAQGVEPDTLVGVITDRSLEMMIGIYGILKAGAAYLPIDPDYPLDRIKYILADSQTEIVLTQQKLLEEGGLVLDCQTIPLDDQKLYQGDATDLEPINTVDHLAYMIYTSGSTGNPKGVMIEHRSVLNFIQGVTDRIDFASHASILALTTISFDIFGLETLLPLAKGLKVVIGNDEHQKDTKALRMVIEKNKVEMLQMTPSRMRMLLNDDQSAVCLKDVQVIMMGGEPLSPKLLAEVKEKTDARIYNMYGPTETTIWSSIQELTDMLEVTIGTPIANTGMVVMAGALDQGTGYLQPVGVPGELCIVGEGLARGYWNRPDLTAEKFVPNPFYTQSEEESKKQILVEGEKMYRTGDLVKWRANGQLEFIGRVDHQVKIRGHRIELGEIETQLTKHPGIQEAVVIDREDTGGNKYLCAYLTGVEELQVAEMKAHLSRDLPDYMLPTYFIQMKELPYTPNGKIDRKALPEPDAGMVSGVEYVAPSTEIEEKLIKIWEEVLGIEGIGVKHNFFEIGGNSINIIKVISLISQRMGIQVTMGELFLYPTVAEIAHNMFITSPIKGMECVISLNKPTEGKKNVFIIHTWEGIIYQYKELAKLLEGEYNVYGIQAKGVMKPAKLPETLEEMVTDYIVEIKTIQPEGPYIIAGYCYGNWIAYKMVDMLEDQGVPIDRMIQIDENAWMVPKIRRYYRARTIISAPYRFIRGNVRKWITRRGQNPMDYWPTLEEHLQSKPVVEGEIKNERTVREHVNHLCTVGYNPKHIIKADTYVIKAEENNLVRFTAEDWKKQTDGKVWFTEIPGGHESIFTYPYIEGLAKAFKRALEE